MFFSAECSHCFTTNLPSLVTDFLPAQDYLALARKSSQWTAADQERQQKIVEAVLKIPPELNDTCFGIYFPLLIGGICDPDGFNYHTRTHNSNGKLILEYLIKASLGKCKPLNPVYRDILVCPGDRSKYFRIDHTTHSKGQPHSDPSKYSFTGDVVAMSFKTDDKQRAVQWMRADSPRTPKCIVGEAEQSSIVSVITQKVQKMKSVVEAYSVGSGREVLGLVLGGNLMLQAIIFKDNIVEKYDPINGKDLSEVVDLSATLKELNAYLHGTCLDMTDLIRSDLPVRSRSTSIDLASPPVSSSTHSYFLRSRS